MLLASIQNSLIYNAAGISGVTDSFLNDWVSPIFILVVAATALYFLFNREIRKLLVFLGIAAIVGALVFFGEDMFGKNGSMSKTINKEAQKINTIMPSDVKTSDMIHFDIIDIDE